MKRSFGCSGMIDMIDIARETRQRELLKKSA